MLYETLKAVVIIQKHIIWWSFYEIKRSLICNSYSAAKEKPRPKFSFSFNKEKAEKEGRNLDQGLMPFNEAMQILQMPNEYTLEMVEERADKLFKLNDPTKGGSFYIQCKIMGAKITLVQALVPTAPVDEPEEPSPNKPQ
jgi:hypothetical protein